MEKRQKTILNQFHPTIAEYAFLEIAQKWYADIKENPYIFRSADILALSCLLLAVEWGMEFSVKVRDSIEKNKEAVAEHNDFSWFNQLPWELCYIQFTGEIPSETTAIEKLTMNLTHENSSIRYWMIELAWFVRRWLPVSCAIPLLLKNLADTLHGPFESAGLVASLVGSKQFWNVTGDFVPSDSSFSKQYVDRLKVIKEEGFMMTQASFWELEAHCRKIIEEVVLGMRLQLSDLFH